MGKPRSICLRVFSLYNHIRQHLKTHSTMKNKMTAVLFASLFSPLAFSQVLNMKTDFLPNPVDNNNFYVYYSVGYFIPKKETTTFQKSRLKDDAIQGARFTKGEIEIICFPSKKYDREIQPHARVKIDFVPSIYLSSSFCFGFSSKSLGSSFGVSCGNYQRRVPVGGNFTTRRKRSFEAYPLFGFYLQSSSNRASFYFSLAFEKTHQFWSTRTGIKVGESLNLGHKGSLLRSTQAVASFESLSGAGLGISFSPFKNLRIDILVVDPIDPEVEESARNQYKLTPGVMVRVAYYVN